MPNADELAEICREWTPYSLATFYEWVFAEQGFKLPAHFWPVCLALTDMRIRNLQLIIGPGCGKALANETLVYTPQGSLPICEVRVGDFVRTPSGGFSLVKAVIPQPEMWLYRLVLRDTRSIIANGEHLWDALIAYPDGTIGRSVFTTSVLQEYLQLFDCKVFLPTFRSGKDLNQNGMVYTEVTAIMQEGIGGSTCINIAAADGLFVAGDYIVTHNSQMFSVVYPAWMIGHDPAHTILGISGGEGLMQGFQQAVMRIVETSPAFLSSFPQVKPDKGSGWSSERGMYVTGHPAGIPDPNYLATGVNSMHLTGRHARTLIIDDLHNKDNSSTADACAKVKEAYFNTILGRADPMGARFIVAGRRWSTEDIYGSLIESESFVTLRLPFIRDGAKELYFDVYVPDDVECVFTDRMVHCGDGSVIKV